MSQSPRRRYPLDAINWFEEDRVGESGIWDPEGADDVSPLPVVGLLHGPDLRGTEAAVHGL